MPTYDYFFRHRDRDESGAVIAETEEAAEEAIWKQLDLHLVISERDEDEEGW